MSILTHAIAFCSGAFVAVWLGARWINKMLPLAEMEKAKAVLDRMQGRI